VTDTGERERFVTALLDSWPWELGGCLVGGYAVAAYGKPRYSRDADFVIPEAAREPITNWVIARGLMTRAARGTDGNPIFDDARNFESKEASIDMMFGRVRDRETRVSIPEREISTNSRKVRLELITGSTETPITVCRPEALWALKLVAARDQDLSDLFAISEEPTEFGQVWEILERHQTPQLVSRLKQVPIRLQSRKIFLDALSARSMRTQGQAASLKQWERFVRIVEPLRRPETFPFTVS